MRVPSYSRAPVASPPGWSDGQDARGVVGVRLRPVRRVHGRDPAHRVQVEAAGAGQLVVDACQVAVGAVGVRTGLDRAVIRSRHRLGGQAAQRVDTGLSDPRCLRRRTSVDETRSPPMVREAEEGNRAVGPSVRPG